ncbi:FeoB-associated Cys-rich membrane protein [Clostridium sp. HBUAS56010]|uniref:FeoB-associated Cys-rich membrane protein n=1 Tax=Clostridium sp. HBUAS56010 TaxID=2571127 RepID=UPI0011777B51|nr:FeoB-associated Cys-rich membrane protein [Clostridium sp. HBUAS56010]
MLLWFSVNGPTIFITLILMALVIAAGKKITKRKGGCGHCCGNCSGCYLNGKEEQEENKKSM